MCKEVHWLESLASSFCIFPCDQNLLNAAFRACSPNLSEARVIVLPLHPPLLPCRFLWMVRIGGGVFPQIKEPDYLNNGDYRTDAGGTPKMLNCLM